MFFDVGLTPITTLLIAVLAFSILSDFLLELFSVRISLSSGRIQNWLFEHIGQNIFYDFLISISFQFFSFRKKAFLMQYSSLASVGSFTRKQVLIFLSGSLIGFGLSMMMLAGGHLIGGVFLCALSFALSLWSKDQLKDLGVAFLGLGLFLVSLFYFDQYISNSGLSLHQFQIGEALFIGLMLVTTLFFRTPIAFLILLAMTYYFVGLKVMWLPAFFFAHHLVGSARFYFHVFQGYKRLEFSALNLFMLQVIQLIVSYGLLLAVGGDVEGLLSKESFLGAYRAIILGYFLYMSLSVLIMSPILFLMTLTPLYRVEEGKKKGNQKIMVESQRGSNFSIHLSLFLLRQEFKKFTTTVHTLFKMSRETDHDKEEINHKFVRYQGILSRVGEELKELCFSIGRQRSYRWQVKEIMSYYKYINQLELLVEDLAEVNSLLRKEDQDEEWEKDCRYWLGMQLKIFESFLNYVLGVGKEDPEKVQALIDKSYEFLDRFLSENSAHHEKSSKTFFRITESNGELAQ